VSGAALKVFLVAEGPSELGHLDQPAPERRGRRAIRRAKGYLPPMLRKLFDRPLEIQAQRVTSLGRFERKPRLKGHADRAAKALSLASVFECRVLVFVKDVDRQPGKKKSDDERRKKLRAMHEEIEEGFAAVVEADEVLRVKATPCRMIEAWALGDTAAVAENAGGDAARVDVPSRPETLWGAEQDPASDHPKCVLRRVLGREASAEVFEALAEAADAATLRRCCPESFAPFADEVAKVASAVARAEDVGARPRTRPRRPRERA
jgi:hypothetical protein